MNGMISLMHITENRQKDDTANTPLEHKDKCWEMDGRVKRQIPRLHTYQGKLQRTPCLCLWPTQSSKTSAAQTESAAQRLEGEGGGNKSTELSSELQQKGAFHRNQHKAGAVRKTETAWRTRSVQQRADRQTESSIILLLYLKYTRVYTNRLKWLVC